MSPDKLAVELRQRNGWEAIDLGFQLARHCATPLFGACAAVIACVTALVLLCAWFINGEWRAWAWLLVWWLKPVYDRVALYVLAHAVFGEAVSVRSTLAALPHTLTHSHLLGALTWRRFSPYRSAVQAVDQLEGQPGKAARSRRKLIRQRIGGSANGLMFVAVHFELVLTVGLGGLLMLMAPEGVSVGNWLRDLISPDNADSGLSFTVLSLLSYALVVSFVEPFYVAGGFGLYLKRRTDLEAWDIELQFRRLSSTPAVRAAAALLLCAGLAILCMPQPSVAAISREAAVQQAPAAIKQVLQNPDFGREKTRKTLRLRHDDEPEATSEWPEWLKNFLKSFFEFWEGFGGGTAEAWRGLVWLVLAISGALLVWWLARQLQALKRRRRPAPPPNILAGMDIRPDSLPTDIGAEAQRLIAAQRLREALALLYRAALSRLAHREHIPFQPGDTEGDCLQRVKQARSPTQLHFTRLTQAWQSLAYARRPLAASEAERLRSEWLLAFESTT